MVGNEHRYPVTDQILSDFRQMRLLRQAKTFDY